MDPDLPIMDDNPICPEKGSLKKSLVASPNEDLENPTNPELLYTPHKHEQHILKKLRRERTKFQSQIHTLAKMVKSQT
jgi:hypothetical protein